MKKVKGIIISILISFLAIMIMPFSVVYAASFTEDNIEGVNCSLYDVEEIEGTTIGDQNNMHRFQYTFKFEMVLDFEYLGYITGKFTCSYYAYDVSGNYTLYTLDSGNKSFYVHGNSLVYYVQVQVWNSNVTSGAYQTIYNPAFTLAGSNVLLTGTELYLASFNDLLTDISDGVEAYLYDYQNGSVIENLVTTNQLLNDIYLSIDNIDNNVASILNFLNKYRQYNFPLESFNFVYSSYDIATIYDSVNMFDYIYPLYQFNDYHQLISNYINTDPADVDSYIDIVFWAFQSNGSINMTWTSNYNLVSRKVLSYFRSTTLGTYCYLYHVKLQRGENASNYFSIYCHNGVYFIPIYLGTKYNQHISDDFAQQFDLIDTTSQDNLDNNTDQLDDQMTDLFNIEDGYGTQLNDQLDNIDFTNPLQNNSSMLSSGNFVIQVFNGLIANNPLSVLIIIVCIFFVARRLFG